MAYEATIASAGGDDSTMAKSFVVACEGSVANWYSYLPPQSINNWYQLKGRLLQDFQGFRRLNANTVKEFKCPSMTVSLSMTTSGGSSKRRLKSQTSQRKMR